MIWQNLRKYRRRAKKKNTEHIATTPSALPQAPQPIALHTSVATPQPLPTVTAVKKENSLPAINILAEPKPILKASIVTGGMLSMSNIYESVKEEHAKELLSESRLNEVNLNTAWRSYMEIVESPSLKSTLDKAEFTIDGKKIEVKVGSKLAQDNIRQTLDLIDYLRKELNDRELMMDIVLDQQKLAELAATAPPKPLTVKEKYEKMTELNPLVDVLRQTFELKLAND